jgi:hypothetical protein
MSQKRAVCAGKRPAAENDGANRTNSLLIGDPDIAALRFFLDGHFGNNGNAHASADHAEQTAELAALENNLGTKPRAVAGGNGGIAETVAVAQEQERLGAKIFERKRRAGVELVFFGERGEEPLGQKWNSHEFVATERERQNGDVDGAGSETLQENWRNLFDHSKSNLWEFARESSQARRKEIRSNCRDDADGDGTTGELFAFDDVAFGGFQFAKDGVGAREKRLAKLGEPHGAPEAVEEAGAEFILQLEDLLGERRLGYVRLFRSAAERASLSHGAEVTELVEFHERTSNQ